MKDINSWSLTFKQPTVEESFLASRRAGLIRAIFWSCLVLVPLTLVNVYYVLISFMEGHLDIEGLRSVALHRAVVGSCFTLFFMLIVILTCRSSSDCFSLQTRKLEALVSWCLVIFMPGVVFFDWHYMVKLYNVDEIHLMLEDQQCYKYASDTRLMLTWIALSTSSHFFLNLRWFMLLPCEVSGIFSYGFCALLGSPEGIFNLPMNLALFTGITVLASMAKRQLEHHERKSMLQLISERIKRCDSEFKLEQVKSASAGGSTPNMTSLPVPRAIDTQSVVTDQTGVTRFTQALFDVKSNCREQLAEMMKLGRQEHWLIEAGQLQFDPKELIGRGNYGVILAGDLLGMSVAVKLPLANASLSLPDLANELRFLRRVRHPHIVAFQGACNLPDAEMLFLVEELVRGTSLQALMNGKLVLNPREKHGVLLGICRALRYLHGLRPSIAHGDLKPSNVLVVDRDKMPKLIDFGLSRIRANKSRQLGGTPRYMAPEVLTKSAQMSEADKADVFSFGRVIFFVLTDSNPLQGLSVQDAVGKAEKKEVPPLDWPSGTPFQHEAVTLTTECLHATPSDRLSAEGVEKRLCTWISGTSHKQVEEDGEVGDPAARLVNACAAAARLYLMQKNQI